MKLKSLSLICMVALVPTLVAAASPESPAPQKKDVAALGRLDALLTLCTEADAKNRSTYERYRTEMIVFGEGTPYEMRVEGSDTPEYERARAETVDAAGRASHDDLARQCRQMIGLAAEGAN